MDKDFWETLCIPYDEITSEIDKYIRKTRLELLTLSNSHLQSINNIYFNISEDDKEKLIEKIMESPKIVDFICLCTFYKGKKQIINEYLKRPVLSHLIEEKDFLVEFYALLKAFNENPDYLKDGLLYCEFKKKAKGDLFIISPIWVEKDHNDFEGSIRGLKLKVARRYKGKKFILVRKFNDGDYTYYVFHRQKNQRIAMAFAKNVSLIGKSDLFIRFDNNGKFVEIRSHDASLRNSVSDHIATTCNKTFFYEESETPSFDITNKIQDILTEAPSETGEDDLIIEQATIKETISPPKNCIKVGKKNGGDIRKTIKCLHEQNICDIGSKDNITCFHINYNGLSVGIKLKKEKDESFSFAFTKHNFSDKKINDLKEKILREWGINIETFYGKSLSKEDKLQFFSKFLHWSGGKHLTKQEKEFIEELSQAGIIKTSLNQIWRCNDNRNHIFSKKYEKCPDCDGKLSPHKEYDNTSMNYFGIKSYIRNKLSFAFGKDHIKEITRKYRGTSYNFLKIQNEEFVLYIFIDTDRNINKVLEFCSRSSLPTIILSIFKPLKGDIDPHIFSNILLQDFYFSNQSDLLKSVSDNLKDNYYHRINESAELSKKKLQAMLNGDKEYTDKDLENDTFNLLKFIFGTGTKWGSEKNRSTVPEGVIGYSTYYKKRKVNYKSRRITFIWDCKHHGKEKHYNFNKAEQDKARRYIKQANDSDSIKKFSGKLNSYFTFCNEINETNYKNFSNTLYRITTWKGSVVLFDLDALIKLYEFCRTNSELIHEKQPIFLNLFSELIERPEDKSYIQITKESIEKIIKKIKEISLPEQIDSEELRITFELDEIK